MASFRDTHTPIQAWLKPDDVERLDAYRRQYPNPPSRAAAVRQVIRFGLDAMLRELKAMEPAE
jgi:hypothetical protein